MTHSLHVYTISTPAHALHHTPQQREREFYVGTIDTYRYCTVVELLYLRLQLANGLRAAPDHHRDPVALGTVGGSGRALAELRDPE